MTHGIGAVVSVLTKFVHPSQLIRDKFPNLLNGQRLSDCITLRQEVKRINQKEKLSLIVKHDDFKNDDEEYQELHACKRHFQIQMRVIRNSSSTFHNKSPPPLKFIPQICWSQSMQCWKEKMLVEWMV